MLETALWSRRLSAQERTEADFMSPLPEGRAVPDMGM
jgi:hypothetical protein